MNRIFIGVGLLILLGCNSQPAPPPVANTLIKGSVTGAYTGQIELLDANGFQAGSSTLGEKGDFNISIVTSTGSYYKLVYKDLMIPVYLSPDYQLQLYFDPGDLQSTVRFSGRGKESNEYMLAFGEFEKTNKPAYDQLLIKSEADFLLEARRYRSKCEAFLKNYQEHHFNLDPNFITKERARILYAWANRLIHYPEAHLYYTGEDEFVVSDTYHDYKKTVNLDASELISLAEYQQFVLAYIDSEAEILQKKGDKRQSTLIRYDLCNQLITEPQIRDFAQFKILQQSLRLGNDDETGQLARAFSRKSENALMRTEIKSMLDQWEAIGNGRPAPSFMALTRDGKSFDMQSLNGKFVYLRFWASWCQPCLTEVEVLQDLDDSLADLIVVSVNLDETKEQWLHELPDTLLSSSQIEVQVPQDHLEKVKALYMINSMPRYIFIGPDGRLLDSMAPGPHSFELREMMDSYLASVNS